MAEHESRPIFVKGRPWQAFHNCFHICNFRLGPFAGNFHAKADTKKYDETDPIQRANRQGKPAGKRPSTPDHPAILAFNTPEAQVGSARYLPGPICRRSARSVPKINTPSPPGGSPLFRHGFVNPSPTKTSRISFGRCSILRKFA